MSMTVGRTLALTCLLVATMALVSCSESPNGKDVQLSETLARIQVLEKVPEGTRPSNPDNLSYIDALLEKCRSEQLDRQVIYWEVRRARSEAELELLRLRRSVLESDTVSAEEESRLSRLELEWAARTLPESEKAQAEAAWKRVEEALTAVNLPYGWHLVKLHLLRDLVNRCQRAAFYNRAGSSWPLVAFRSKLARKFGSIEKLNQAWRTSYGGFDEIFFPPSPFSSEGFKPSALSYEFQVFRMESWSEFIDHCIRCVQAGAPGLPVGTEGSSITGSFANGTVHSHRLWKSSPASYFEDHHNNWSPNYAALRMHYDLCLYAGRQPIETEWIWTYPRLIDPETEEDFRVTGELSFWRKTVWGRKLLQAFAFFGGWEYNNGYYDQRASMVHNIDYGATGAFVREAATSLVTGKRRAREFEPILMSTEVIKPQIGLLVPTTSMINEYPFQALPGARPSFRYALSRGREPASN